MIDHLDHLVLTCTDPDATIAFYTGVLGMQLETFRGGRQAYRVGNQKSNLHVRGSEFEPKAHLPVPGALDLCFIADRPLDDVIAAVRTVARGEALNNVEWANAVDGDTAFADAQLSTREREVLRLYATGLPLKVVAERLGVAYSTAKENITRIRVKYVEVGRPAPTKVDLLRRAMEDGIVEAAQEDPQGVA